MSAANQAALADAPSSGGRSPMVLISAVVFALTALWSAFALSGEASATAWAMLAVSFVYLVGITQYGVAFVAIMRICGAHWPRPLMRLAELITLAGMPLAVVTFLILWAFGQEALFFWADTEEHVSPWLSSGAMLWRNGLAMLAFYAAAVVYFLGGLIPDLDTQADGSKWRRLHAMLRSSKAARKPELVERRLYYWSPLILVLAMITQTFISWDFGMMLVPHWHSTIFPMYYIIGNMFAGTAMILLLSVLLAPGTPLAAYITTVRMKNFGIMLTGFALLWLYFFWAQFFVTWYGNLPEETTPMWRQMYGHYAPLFWTQMLCIIGIPIASLISAKVKRTVWTMVLIAAIMNVGIWINRYLMVVPFVALDHYPFTASVDYAVTAASISGFLFILALLYRSVPALPMWELRNPPDDAH